MARNRQQLIRLISLDQPDQLQDDENSMGDLGSTVVTGKVGNSSKPQMH
jgi:hypothetical protein